MIQRKILKPHYYILFAAALMLLCLFSGILRVSAAEGFELYADNPGIHVTAGDSVSFDLYLSGSNAADTDVALSVVSMPDGFTGYFKSGSYEVSKVHARGDSTESAASFQVTVPSEAEDGTHEIVLRAVSDSGYEDELTLSLTVSELKAGESNFYVEYPDQEGVSGASFSYSTTIANNTLNTQNYNFSSNAPAGWNVSFTSDSTQISSLEIESGSSAGVTITVTAPNNTEAGEYQIECAATSAKEQLSTTLNVTILGSYDMSLSTVDEKLSFDAYANTESDVTLKITNNGNMDLENISLSSSAPSGWEVSFDTTTIDLLEAGASTEVTAHVTPGDDALTGDYVTIMTASCDNQSASAEFRITVKTQTGWGIFAVIIIIAVAGGLYYVMKKYGRR
ncbi:MAG: NEW3 domain-containing protein [Clostridiales bacterium]|nr:NEW3 domain-containing protein [Clostridiales bacterium]